MYHKYGIGNAQIFLTENPTEKKKTCGKSRYRRKKKISGHRTQAGCR
jgi:hypothetical protein